MPPAVWQDGGGYAESAVHNPESRSAVQGGPSICGIRSLRKDDGNGTDEARKQ